MRNKLSVCQFIIQKSENKFFIKNKGEKLPGIDKKYSLFLQK